MPRRSDLRNDGDRYMTSNERARLKTPPIVLQSWAQLAEFLGNHETDFQRVFDAMSDADADRRRMARDLSRVVMFSTASMQANGVKFDDNAEMNDATLAALVLALKKPAAAAAPVSGADADINFSGESTAYVASTEQFIGSDGVPAATQVLAGCIPDVPRTFSRVQAAVSATFIAAGATLRINVYGTTDGVNFTLLGSVTFTGDGATRLWDSSQLSAIPAFTAQAATAGGKNPGYQLGIVSSANLTTRLGVRLT